MSKLKKFDGSLESPKDADITKLDKVLYGAAYNQATEPEPINKKEEAERADLEKYTPSRTESGLLAHLQRLNTPFEFDYLKIETRIQAKYDYLDKVTGYAREKSIHDLQFRSPHTEAVALMYLVGEIRDAGQSYMVEHRQNPIWHLVESIKLPYVPHIDDNGHRYKQYLVTLLTFVVSIIVVSPKNYDLLLEEIAHNSFENVTYETLNEFGLAILTSDHGEFHNQCLAIKLATLVDKVFMVNYNDILIDNTDDIQITIRYECAFELPKIKDLLKVILKTDIIDDKKYREIQALMPNKQITYKNATYKVWIGEMSYEQTKHKEKESYSGNKVAKIQKEWKDQKSEEAYKEQTHKIQNSEPKHENLTLLSERSKLQKESLESKKRHEEKSGDDLTDLNKNAAKNPMKLEKSSLGSDLIKEEFILDSILNDVIFHMCIEIENGVPKLEEERINVKK